MSDDFQLLPPKAKRAKFAPDNVTATARRLFPDADDLPGQQVLFADWYGSAEAAADQTTGETCER